MTMTQFLPALTRPTIRHETTPTPSGCRWCGYPQATHMTGYARSVSYHPWARPTDQQILARMKARYAARTA
jgi:hypothetical protein